MKVTRALEKIVENGFLLLDFGSMEHHEHRRTRSWIVPVSAAKLIYTLVWETFVVARAGAAWFVAISKFLILVPISSNGHSDRFSRVFGALAGGRVDQGSSPCSCIDHSEALGFLRVYSSKRFCTSYTVN